MSESVDRVSPGSANEIPVSASAAEPGTIRLRQMLDCIAREAREAPEDMVQVFNTQQNGE